MTCLSYIPLFDYRFPDTVGSLRSNGFLLNPEKTDLELIIAVSGGDRDSLGTLYQRHAKTLSGIVSRFKISVEAKEDLIQEIFLEVWAKAFDYDPKKGSVLTWLAVRTRSRAIDVYRKELRRRALLEKNSEVARPRVPTPPGTFVVQRSLLRDAISTLDEDLRVVTMLAYFDGETTNNIALSLGIKQGTVKSRLRRAREVLYHQLGGDE